MSALKAIGDRLIDLHGQHEHQSLLKPSSHLEFLDRWLGEPALSLRHQVRQTVSALRQTERDLQELTAREREREQMLDLYRFQVDEIRASEPAGGRGRAAGDGSAPPDACREADGARGQRL
jgi:DNA repair protein RecN (Recombination protein N)